MLYQNTSFKKPFKKLLNSANIKKRKEDIADVT